MATWAGDINPINGLCYKPGSLGQLPLAAMKTISDWMMGPAGEVDAPRIIDKPARQPNWREGTRKDSDACQIIRSGCDA